MATALRVFCLVSTSVLGISASMGAPPTDQDKFFKLVAANDAVQMLDMMSPELRAAIDAPVLAAWMASFNERLGPAKSFQLEETYRKQTRQGILHETHCKVNCQHGQAKSRLTLLNGKVVGFDVTSDRMKHFFTGPASTDLYEEMGERFIRTFLSGRAEAAHGQCHAALQEVVSLTQIRDMIELIRPHVGTPVRIQVTESRMSITDDADNLLLDFEVQGDAGTVTCEIKIEFVGLQGHLLGFDFQAP